jgi:hypothetical protein
LVDGYTIIKTTSAYPGMNRECFVAGRLMGLCDRDWWYVFAEPGMGTVFGILEKKLFLELYQHFYLIKSASLDFEVTQYTLNALCPIQEFPRYQRQMECWREFQSRPGEGHEIRISVDHQTWVDHR